MATKMPVDLIGMDDTDWDTQAAGLFFGALLLGAPAGGTLKRGGVVPGVGTPLKVVPKTAMKVTVKAGIFLMPMVDKEHGVRPMFLHDDFDIDIPTAHASQPRTDLVIAELIDNGEDPGSEASFRLLPGTAGVGAPAPVNGTALGNGNWFALGSVAVAANATSINAGNITDLRVPAGLMGGPVNVPNLAAAVQLPEGTVFYAQDYKTLGWRSQGFTDLVQGRVDGGTFVGTCNAAGRQNILHNLGQTPRWVSVTLGTTGDQPLDNITAIKVEGKDAFSISVRYYRTDTNLPFSDQNDMVLHWSAGL